MMLDPDTKCCGIAVDDTVASVVADKVIVVVVVVVDMTVRVVVVVVDPPGTFS